MKFRKSTVSCREVFRFDIRQDVSSATGRLSAPGHSFERSARHASFRSRDKPELPHSQLERGARVVAGYTRSPLEDSRLFGPSPWKILAATNEKTYLSNPAPGENLESGNLVMETGCTIRNGKMGGPQWARRQGID